MRCRVGDLAVIIYSLPELASNIGGMVRVTLPSDVPKHDWVCIALSPLRAFRITLLSIEVVPVPAGTMFHIPDAWLQPIRGPRAEEGETQTKEVRDDARV